MVWLCHNLLNHSLKGHLGYFSSIIRNKIKLLNAIAESYSSLMFNLLKKLLHCFPEKV